MIIRLTGSAICIVIIFLIEITINCQAIRSRNLRERRRKCHPKITQVFIGFRHGARATFKYLSDDPNNDYFKMAPGQLTKTGLQQMYTSGENVRQRYAGFLRSAYMPNEVRIRSTMYDRTVMSAATFAAALFRPSQTEEWCASGSCSLHWQPVAIFTSKNLVAIDPSQPTKNKIMKKTLQELIELDNRLMETVMAIEEATSIEHTKQFQEFFYIIENFKTQIFYNLTLGYGLDGQKNQLEQLIDKLIIMSYSDPDIFCLNAPTILNDIIGQIDKYIAGETQQYFNIYSAHDGHVMAVLSSLSDQRLTEMTPFASTFFIEIHENSSCNGRNVKLFYRSQVTAGAREMHIRKCGRQCTLENFRQIVDNILTKCNFNSTNSLDDV